MKALIVLTAIDPTEYVHPSLSALEPMMQPEEKAAAMVKGWLIKGVEVGGNEVYGFRIAADHAPNDLDSWILEAAEVDTQGVVARAYVRQGQTGAVEATVTFQVAEVTRVDRQAVLKEHALRQKQAKETSEARKGQREAMERLKARIEDRLKGGTAEPAGKSK